MADEHRSIGRPTDYRPEYCELAVEEMAKGYSLGAFAGTISGRRRCAGPGIASRTAFREPLRGTARLTGAYARGLASSPPHVKRSRTAATRGPALPVAVHPMPSRKGEHELPGFVAGFNLPAVGEDEGLRERTRPGHTYAFSVHRFRSLRIRTRSCRRRLRDAREHRYG